jgi:hypothetical protein
MLKMWGRNYGQAAAVKGKRGVQALEMIRMK